jgi:hypothetical protein
MALVEEVGDHLTAIGLDPLKRINAYEYGVWIYDDMCSLRGPMFSPATFERIFFPVYQKMIAAFKLAGDRVFFEISVVACLRYLQTPRIGRSQNSAIPGIWLYILDCNGRIALSPARRYAFNAGCFQAGRRRFESDRPLFSLSMP